MLLDKQTVKNLELMSSFSGDKSTPTLYSILDITVTTIGSRLLSQWIKKPLIDPLMIRERLDAVEELFSHQGILQKLRHHLSPIKDIELLLARINCGTPSARDIVALGYSLKAVPQLKETTSSLQSRLVTQQFKNLFELRELTGTIERAFVEVPPPGVRDGGFIKIDYSKELDDVRSISRNAKQWIVSLQKKEIEKTGIKSLKIKYNKVFGYYIEVTKPNLPMVPDYYMRKQTLVNAERFTVPELKEYEEKILGAEEKAKELEYELFEKVRGFVLQFISEIQKTADAIAILDLIASFATAAIANNYCKPEISDSSVIYIAGGRHPVVEHTLGDEQFVDNDVLLDTDENQLLIITGPNMAGKSTFIRQVALIVLMAQIGSYVPARIAKVGVVDRVFSRIGASDNLARGESTFMVEMIETANILHNATSRSLLVFDEIGRGTSTFDGVSIAWSVCEYLNHKKFRPKCLFATHYHELTELTDHRKGIKNFNVTVKEIEDNILFLRKVVPGSSDKSYGIHVGKLAGLPMEIIDRAGEILLCLEEEKISDESISGILKKKKGSTSVYDLPLFKPLKEEARGNAVPFNAVQKTLEDHPLIKEIKSLDINSMTPLDALMKIVQWRKDLKEENDSESINRDS
jgi:DNA mismatch repair protein MutS